MNRAILKVSLVKHEDKRAHPYDDATGKPLKPGSTLFGKLTIGVGRNLSDKPLRDDEIALMLDNDVNDALADAMRLVPTFASLPDGVQRVLVEMAFNLGAPKLAKFKRFLAAIDDRDFKRAADEMLSSTWARQVGSKPGQRADTLAQIVRDAA